MLRLGLGLSTYTGRSGPPVPFDPSFNSPEFWVDPYGVPASVSLAVTAVTGLADLSTNNRDLVQGTSGSRPSFDGTKITFDGTDDFLHGTAFAYNLPEKAIYAVVNITNGDNKCVLGEASTTDGDPGYCIFMTGGTNKLVPYMTNDSGGFVKAFTDLGSTVVTGAKKLVRIHDKNGLMTAYINGSLGDPKTYPRSENTLTLDRFALGCRPSSSPGFHAPFDLYELIIAPNDNLGQQYEGYLAHKHGLTGSLPADHPYKTEPPMQGESTNYTPALNTGAIQAALFGDSITAANSVNYTTRHTFQPEGYFTSYNALAGSRMTQPIANNKGVGGDRLTQMISRMTDLAALTFDVCFVMGGTNNVANGDNLIDLINDMDTILNYITGTLRKTAVLLTIMPRTHDSDAAARKVKINTANTYYMNAHLSREGRVISVNVYDCLDDGNDEPISGTTYDGLHPVPYGGMLMGQEIHDRLLPYFGDATQAFTGNLLTNGSLAGTGGSTTGTSGSVATGWAFNATAGSPVASKNGLDQQVLTTNYTSSTGDDALSFTQTATTGFTNGDTVYAMAEIEVENVANIDKLTLELYALPDTAQTLDSVEGFSGGSYPIAETYIEPGTYTIRTPDLTVNGSVTSLELRLVQQVDDGSTTTTSTITIKRIGIFKV